ncbi:hypothetical protein [Woodsholea maritima]|uniref:hypothetical protein n=1 Tax=Woodsholea maritima TaxID=240237 RepID=UPI00037C39E5|nr:hypothetical protein [Woodsholea maritima]
MAPDLDYAQLDHLLDDERAFARLVTAHEALHVLVLLPQLRFSTETNAQLGMSAIAQGLGIIETPEGKAGLCLHIGEWEYDRHHQLLIPASLGGFSITITAQGAMTQAAPHKE